LNIGDDLKVSISNSGGWSGQWRYYDTADGSRFENRWKQGFYLNTKADMTLEVKNSFPDGDWSSEWILSSPLSEMMNYKLENKWKQGMFINVNADSSVSIVGTFPGGDWSAQWVFVSNGTDPSWFKIVNRWKAGYYLNIGDDLKVSISNSGDWSGQWKMHDTTDGTRFENRWKAGFYLNTKADMTLEVQNSFPDGDWSSTWALKKQ